MTAHHAFLPFTSTFLLHIWYIHFSSFLESDHHFFLYLAGTLPYLTAKVRVRLDCLQCLPLQRDGWLVVCWSIVCSSTTRILVLLTLICIPHRAQALSTTSSKCCSSLLVSARFLRFCCSVCVCVCVRVYVCTCVRVCVSAAR